MDSGKTPGALILVYQIVHMSCEVILYKLKYYGVMGTDLRLLTDFLTNRKKYVRFNNHNSDTTNISTGVPQGS